MEVNPYSEIYHHIFSLSESLGYDTYDYLPDDVDYPLVFIGEQFSEDKVTKTKMRGESSIVIHCFSYERNRRDVETMMNRLNTAIYQIGFTDHFYWSVGQKTNRQQLFFENQTEGQALVHGVLDISLEFIGKGE